jgi:hypothetical protein
MHTTLTCTPCTSEHNPGGCPRWWHVYEELWKKLLNAIGLDSGRVRKEASILAPYTYFQTKTKAQGLEVQQMRKSKNK